MYKSLTYNKKEKIKSRTVLSDLFTSSPKFLVFPIKVFYRICKEQAVPLQVGVGVSKRNFKKAVHRNKIKRLLREMHRLTKNNLLAELELNQKNMQVFYLYTHNELPNLELLLEKQQIIQQKLLAAIHENSK